MLCYVMLHYTLWLHVCMYRYIHEYVCIYIYTLCLLMLLLYKHMNHYPSLSRAPDEVLESRKPRLGKSNQWH